MQRRPYALALVVATGLLCGLVPAWRATRANVVADIQSGDSYGATGRLWARNAFVVGQVAVSIILLVVSSLMLRSLQRITTLDPGFDLDRGVVAAVNVDANRYAVDGGLPLGERIVDALAGLPGVESSSFAGILALGTDTSATSLQVEGQPGPTGTRTYLNSVGPNYFATLGIPIVAGREFDARDRQGAPPVAIVSEAFARTYFPGESALGKRVRRSPSDPYFEIVGIARDSKYGSVAEAPTPLFYSAYTQRPQNLVSDPSGCRSCPYDRRPGSAGQRRSQGHHRHRSGGVRRCANAARRDECGSRAPALRHTALRRDRRGGAAAGHDRPLRGDGVRGVLADA